MTILNIAAIIFVLTVYLVPTMVAVARRHVNAMPILLTNLYLGFTGIGWIIALIWAFSNTAAMIAAASQAPAATARAVSDGRAPGKNTMKYVLAGLGLVVVAVLLLILLAPAPRVMTDGGPEIKTGAPIAADELFGK